MPYNPTATDMATAAEKMARAIADTCRYLDAEADLKLWTAVSKLDVRTLAALHHFITVPQREG